MLSLLAQTLQFMADISEKSRYISKEVRHALANESRGRCCLCREAIIPGLDQHLRLAEVLEHHHIIFFSEGGEHTIENLLLVCPSCHRLIHKKQDDYTTERLRKAKRHWTALASVVPSDLLYEGRPPKLESSESMKLRRISFSLETLGLDFSVTIPDGILVKDILEYLRSYIIQPIGKFDNDQDWIQAERIQLSHRKNTTDVFMPTLRVNEIELETDDAFVLHIHRATVAAPATEDFSLMADPPNPKAGQSYALVLLYTPPHQGIRALLDIQGTDGYRAHHTGETDFRGAYSCQVPGARAGVVDTVMGQVDQVRKYIKIVFLHTDDDYE